ncbi:hypothetical protein [uncultured Phenylobacterium sp.]|uniref:hypothetical protein n=1 Tax=uncultured Phenylobacterium sp. TaxID=349273 RepID=UPI0025F18CEA|nr:hypothetical protein [uncultured Phenylobacterium sp.]
MLDALDITEEEAQGLAELARHDLALARSFAARAQAAEDGEEASRLARSYQRAARSYRQTLALKARLKRDLAAAARVQAQTPRPKPGGAAIARRIGELRTALLRLAWDEAERPEDDAPETEAPDAQDVAQAFGWHRQDVEGVITEACLQDSFCDDPLDDHVARLALDIGFPPDAIARWRNLPDPPKVAFALHPDDDEWRSSA